MTIHGMIQKLKEAKKIQPTGLIQRGAIFMPVRSSLLASLGAHFDDSHHKEEKQPEKVGIERNEEKQIVKMRTERSEEERSEEIGVALSLMTYLNSAFPQYENKHASAQKPMADMDIDDTDAKTLEKRAAVFTFDEIYERLAKRIERLRASSERLHFVVIVADKSKWVTGRKARAQKKRPSNPYPEGSRVGVNGIVLQDGPGGVECAVQVQRMMQTRKLREDFFIALRSKAIHDPRWASAAFDEQPPTLIWAVAHSLPVEIFKGSAREMKECTWQIGEDDIEIPVWCQYFAQTYGTQCLVQTCDRDLEQILTLRRATIPRHLVLDFEDGRHVIIHANAERVIAAGWTIAMWAAMHMLSGTDFCDKSDLTAQIGIDVIFQAGFALCKSKQLTSVHTNIQDLILLLRMVYSRKLDSTTLLTIAQIQIKCSRFAKLNWPSKSKLQKGFDDLVFNFGYWSNAPAPESASASTLFL